MILNDLVDKIFYLIYDGRSQEQKLVRYNGYRHNTIIKWKNQTDLSWATTFKLLKQIEVFDAIKIRQVISTLVENNRELFEKEHCYITSFGSEGKSGGIICYEFKHTRLIRENRFKDSWDITKIPSNSTIIFVEDLIGTGTQSVEHINDKLNLLLNPSHDPILLTLCATPEGIQKVSENTNFKVINAILLDEENYQFSSEKSKYFTLSEKNKLQVLNNMLKPKQKESYDRGLLIAFYYSVPNNSMPILWKDNYGYEDRHGKQKKWIGLLPRAY